MSNLYIYDQGTVLNYQQNRLLVKDEKKQLAHSIPIENVSNVILFGNIQVSAACMQTMLTRGVNLTWLSKTGEYFGRLESTSHVNIQRQRLQFRLGEDRAFCLALAKQFLLGKCKNQRTILQRHQKNLHNLQLEKCIDNIESNFSGITKAESIEELMGIEGTIARLYFEGLGYIVAPSFHFSKRTKRPPKDPFNAILSFGYTLLHYEIFTLLSSKGLHPYAAFLHADKHHHPALCSDMMEEWRAILIDSLAIALVNGGKISLEEFNKEEQSQGVFLSKQGCKTFVEEFEKRLRQEVSYVKDVPYKMSFRRSIEHQIMRLIKAMEESKPDLYEPIYIR